MEEVFTMLLNGFLVALEPYNLLFCFIGVIAGAVIGALPGLGPTAGCSVLLPMAFGMNPVTGIILLSGVYYGAMYGGAIASILINTPGDSAAVMTCLDGYPLTRKGRAGAALGMSFFASFIGGTLSVIVFTFLAPSLAKYTLRFGPPEYFSLMLMALTTASGMTGDFPVKGFVSMILGLLLSIVGVDLITGEPRFCFGIPELYSGIDFVTVALGLFGVAEILNLVVTQYENIAHEKIGPKDFFPSKEDWKYSFGHILRGSGLGFFVGMLPGAGATIASFMSYAIAKKTSSRPEEFGKGVIEGVAAPESANNAASVGAWVPLMTLGVPGSATTAVLLGALMMFNLRPGPMIFEKAPQFVWGLIASIYVGNILLILSLFLFVPLFVKVLDIPKWALVSWVLVFIIAGSYSLDNSLFNIGMTLLFGFIGFFMKRLDYPAAPMVLGLVLGMMTEDSLRQSLVLSSGNPMIFLTRPISLFLLCIAALPILFPLMHKVVRLIRSTH